MKTAIKSKTNPKTNRSRSMNIKIKGTGMELTPAITAYIEKKISGLKKFLAKISGDGDILARVEVGIITKHHKTGDIFRAELNLSAGKKKWRAVSIKNDLYAAIDDMRAEMEREVVSRKDKDIDLARKNAASAKSLLKNFKKPPKKGGK